jgi:hypothetical protein
MKRKPSSLPSSLYFEEYLCTPVLSVFSLTLQLFDEMAQRYKYSIPSKRFLLNYSQALKYHKSSQNVCRRTQNAMPLVLLPLVL